MILVSNGKVSLGPDDMRYLKRSDYCKGGYAQQDWDVVDYQLYFIDGYWFNLRGPIAWNGRSDYITFIGAAQTFGRYCQFPFPTLIGSKLGIPFINFGQAGAGPAYFIQKPILDFLNSSRVVVVQVMSGRSVATSLLENPQANGLLKRRGLPNEPLMIWHEAWEKVLEDYGSDFVSNLVEEARATYIAQMKMLLSSIKVPKILLWFSERTPAYKDNFNSLDGFFNRFPHMINERVISELKPCIESYVQVVTKRGVPHKLFNRFNGSVYSIAGAAEKTKNFNYYYPTPEMHEDASESLAPHIQRIFFR